MTSLTITVDDSVSGAMDRVNAALKNAFPAFDTIGSDFTFLISEGFQGSKNPYGEQWEPLKCRDGRPLLDTGRLRTSITHRPKRKSVEIGTNVIYGDIHQGTPGSQFTKLTAGPGKFFMFKCRDKFIKTKTIRVPRRAFIPDEGLPDSWANSALDIFADHITKAIG